jgi:hypothetical protein
MPRQSSARVPHANYHNMVTGGGGTCLLNDASVDLTYAADVKFRLNCDRIERRADDF